MKETTPSQNGILCINKPQNFTSFDVIAKVRGMTRTRKAGHSGTLDPMATGVLPIFLGNATKACSQIPVTDKRYRAGVKLGLTTDTQDVWGNLLKEDPRPRDPLPAGNRPFRFPGRHFPAAPHVLRRTGKRQAAL